MTGKYARAAFFALLPAFGVGGALGIPVLICLAGALSFQPSLFGKVLLSKAWSFHLLALFFALAVASAVWSEHAAAQQAMKVALLALLGISFAAGAARDPRLTSAGAVAAFAVLTVLLAIEAVWAMPLNRAAEPGAEIGQLGRNVSRAASLHLALVWGAAGVLLSAPGLIRTLAAIGALAAGAFISLQFEQFANTLGFAVGIAAFLAALAAPRITLVAVLSGLLFWVLAAPFVTPVVVSSLTGAGLPESWMARIEIWSYVCERIIEEPWFGRGLDAARAHHPMVPIHPHSASLQVWFELGVVGAALASVLIVFAGRDFLRKFGDDRAAAAAAAGTLAALGVVLNVSYNLWAEWWLATLCVAAGIGGAVGERHAKHT